MNRRVFTMGLTLGLLMGFAGVCGVWAMQKKGGMGMDRAPKDKFLDRHVGEWEWTGRMYAGEKTIHFTGSERVEWVCNEQFLLSRMSQTPEGGMPPFEFMTVTRAEPDEGKYTQWLYEGMGMTATAKGTRSGDTILYEGESPVGRSRTTVTRAGDDEAKLVTEAIYPGGSEWVPFMEMKGKKKSR